jgi:hypothetical protein
MSKPKQRGKAMRNYKRGLITAVLFSTVILGAYFGLGGPQGAGACMMGGAPGGGDYYMPQRRNMPQGQFPAGQMAQRPAIAQEQARQIVTTHIQKLNPDLNVGKINDAGSFYEVEVLSRENEIVQLIGVDKFSGGIMPIN